MLARILLAGGVGGALLVAGACEFRPGSAAAQDNSSAQPAAVAGTNSVTPSTPPPVKAPPTEASPAVERRPAALDPIPISNARLALIRKQDVPSQRDGVLLFIGIPVKPGEVVPQEDLLPPVRGEKVQFRRLKEGDWAEAGQLLARVDDTLPLAEQAIKEAKLIAAEADCKAAEETSHHFYESFLTQKRLYDQPGRPATSLEEVRQTWTQHLRYKFESDSKREQIKVSKQELNQAAKTLEMYDLRSKFAGRVKTIYKKDGEAVKQLEPVLQIHNYDQLRVEGMIGAQYFQNLRNVSEVVIEPTNRQNAEQSFLGHRLDITSVAVSNDPAHPLIVSGSEDGTVRVWDIRTRQERIRHNNKVAVRAVACTPAGRKENLCLFGDADGKGRIWDLSRPSQPLELKAKHSSSVRCVAFSPNEDLCATGGDDGQVMIWKTGTGDLRYQIPGHRSAVTGIHFLPQDQLVTVCRDNMVRLWKLNAEGATEARQIRRRFSDIGQLGLSQDGKLVLDEQGTEMRVLSLPDGITQGVLHNPTQASKFRSFALFCPNNKLVLTTSGSDGTLQLWRIDERRCHECRQLISGERAPAACAAFAPDGSFAVSGIRDRIFLWSMPSKAEAERQLVAKVINVEQAVDTTDGQVRVMAEFDNPKDHPLLPGDTVTMVAFPR